jgi:hypothetical protein
MASRWEDRLKVTELVRADISPCLPACRPGQDLMARPSFKRNLKHNRNQNWAHRGAESEAWAA